MTNEEALAHFKNHEYMTDFSWQDEMSEVAISAIEKQAPKKPRLRKGCNWSYRCPNCGKLLFWTDEPKDHGEKNNYCSDCGQKIDWNY